VVTRPVRVAEQFFPELKVVHFLCSKIDHAKAPFSLGVSVSKWVSFSH
jgi:hypothetical protein